MCLHHHMQQLFAVILLQDANRLYLVLEFCAGGDLGHYLRRYRQVSEATARYFLQQVAEGLKELRRHNVIHVRKQLAIAIWYSSFLEANTEPHYIAAEMALCTIRQLQQSAVVKQVGLWLVTPTAAARAC